MCNFVKDYYWPTLKLVVCKYRIDNCQKTPNQLWLVGNCWSFSCGDIFSFLALVVVVIFTLEEIERCADDSINRRKSFYEISQKNNFIKDSSELVVDDDGSDSDSALSPGPEGESEAHHRLFSFSSSIQYHRSLSL